MTFTRCSPCVCVLAVFLRAICLKIFSKNST
uniref:Uncharacterized protein n=1 Tax=Anguilla anguilla TaxID=7936 RepID=A0A0E9RJL8_ANGAN